MHSDQTSLCVPCRRRFVRAERCPVCHGDAIQLTTESRRVASGALFESLPAPTLGMRERAAFRSFVDDAIYPLRAKNGSYARPLIILATMFVLGIGGIALLASRRQEPNPFLMIVALPSVIATCALAMWSFAFAFVLLGHSLSAVFRWLRYAFDTLWSGSPVASAGPIELIPRARPTTQGPGLTTVRGIVRVTTSMTSLVHASRCVAFRLVGRSATDVIDDASCTAFVIECEDGELVDVDPCGEAIIVELEEPGLERVVSPGTQLTEFLDRRTVSSSDLELGESVLESGARVEVTGLCDERLAPGDGYRESRARRFLRATREQPLVVTRRAA